MSTKQRLGIDIVATNKTAQAFASVQNSLGTITRAMSQLKFLMAGFVGGQWLEAMVKNFVEVSKQSAPVKSALDNLNIAWTGFAQNVGEAGLNQALIEFANRMGAMVLGADGLSRSIGLFMSGAIRGMAAVFEAVGRSIAFAYDNAEIFGRLIASIGVVMFAQHVMRAATAFYFFAKTVRATGIIMAAFHTISRANMAVFLLLATGVAYATDSFDTLKAGMDTLWNKAKEVFPEIADVGKRAMEGLGFNLSSLSSELGDATRYIGALGEVKMPLSEAEIQKSQQALDKLKSQGDQWRQAVMTPMEEYKFKLQELGVLLDKNVISNETYSRGVLKLQQDLLAAGNSVEVALQPMQDAILSLSQSLGEGLRSVFDGIIQGGQSASEAFKGLLNTMVQAATDALMSAAIKQLINFLNAGIAPSQQGGFLTSFLQAFGGAKASGGSVQTGKGYLVGERGPEYFKPNVSGRIVPNDKLSNSSVLSSGTKPGAVSVTVNNYSAGKVNTRQNSDGALTIEVVEEAVAFAISRGGTKIDAAMQRGFGLRRAGR